MAHELLLYFALHLAPKNLRGGFSCVRLKEFARWSLADPWITFLFSR
jgi:hypothetical protein